MPKSSKISNKEKQKIAEIAANNDNFGPTKLGELAGRSKSSISRLLSDDQFINYRNTFAKKIAMKRMKLIREADRQLSKKITKMTTHQLISMTKTYYELVFENKNDSKVNINENNVGVQIVRGLPQRDQEVSKIEN